MTAERSIAVAFSGGRDSTALLHATVRSAANLGLQVVALHVNHGLMPQADEWQRALSRRCAAWISRGAPLQLVCERIADKPADGDSVEAWARRVRYLALRRMALTAGCDTVLLAHHRQDQAETFMLQALRGAGVAGLAAMPAVVEREGVCWLRPWLDQPRSAIEAYVARYRLSYVDDASNTDPRFSRNRLRHEVWPALIQAFPQAEQVLGDAARWAGHATQCLHELAAMDLAQVADADAAIILAPWLLLSPARRRNALREWLHQQAGRPAPASLVDRLIDEWPPADAVSARVRGGRVWVWGNHRLFANREKLGFVRNPGVSSSDAGPATPALRQSQLAISAAGRYRLQGWGGELRVDRVADKGIDLARLSVLEVRPRLGAELFQAGPRRPARSLKKQFQAAGVPAWMRDGPLIYAGEQLIFVSGLGLDARAVAEPGGDLVSLTWMPDAADPESDSPAERTAG